MEGTSDEHLAFVPAQTSSRLRSHSVKPNLSGRSDDGARKSVTCVRGGGWNHKDLIPMGFLPEGFSRSVFLATLWLVHRCDKSVLVLIGDPNDLPLGSIRWKRTNDRWKTADLTVFNTLPDDALRDFTSDGAVVVDPRGGKIHEVSVMVNPKEDPYMTVTGGARTSYAFSVSRSHEVIAICKKRKPESSDPDVQVGWVSIFTSMWSQFVGRGHPGPSPWFYRTVYKDFEHPEHPPEHPLSEADLRASCKMPITRTPWWSPPEGSFTSPVRKSLSMVSLKEGDESNPGSSTSTRYPEEGLPSTPLSCGGSATTASFAGSPSPGRRGRARTSPSSVGTNMQGRSDGGTNAAPMVAFPILLDSSA